MSSEEEEIVLYAVKLYDELKAKRIKEYKPLKKLTYEDRRREKEAGLAGLLIGLCIGITAEIFGYLPTPNLLVSSLRVLSWACGGGAAGGIIYSFYRGKPKH